MICVICDEREVPKRSRFGSCQVCRGNIGGWKARGVRAIVEYRNKLRVREARMNSLIDEPVKEATNVLPFIQPARLKQIRTKVHAAERRARV